MILRNACKSFDNWLVIPDQSELIPLPQSYVYTRRVTDAQEHAQHLIVTRFVTHTDWRQLHDASKA